MQDGICNRAWENYLGCVRDTVPIPDISHLIVGPVSDFTGRMTNIIPFMEWDIRIFYPPKDLGILFQCHELIILSTTSPVTPNNKAG